MGVEHIKENDIVDVHWEELESLIHVRVISKPSNEIDDWILWDSDRGMLHHVRRFCRMDRIYEGKIDQRDEEHEQERHEEEELFHDEIMRMHREEDEQTARFTDREM